MIADAQDYVLEISAPLFRLTTEGIRLRSNETRLHESLSSLTIHLAGGVRDMAAHDTDALRQHLKLIPVIGGIIVLLALPPRSVDRLRAIGTSLEKRVGHRLTFEDIISLLLFDYVVEQKAARVLDTLGLGRSDSPELRSDDGPFPH